MIRFPLYKKDIKHRILLILVATVIYAVFYYMYKHEISPTESYRGFIFHQLSLSEFFVSMFFYLFPIFLLPVSLSRPSDISLWALYLFSYAPTAIMCFYITSKGIYSTVFFLISMLCALITLKYCRYHSFNIYSKKKLNLIYIDKIIILLFFLSITAFALKLTEFHFNLDLITAYERRMFAGEMDKGILAGYLISIGRSLLTILGIYNVLVKKKPIYGIFVIIFSLAIFSFQGTKSALVVPVILSIMSLIYSRSKYLLWFPIVVGIVAILSLLEFSVLKTNILSGLFTRRIIAVPGFLNTVYWDFFSENNKVLLTDSIGRYFLDPVYDRPAPFIIGQEFFNNINSNANTGIWMGAFTHFGVVGIFIISAMAGFILGLIDNLTKTHYFILGTLVCLYIGINWSEQMLHTSMLTGGIIYNLLFLIFVRSSTIIRPEGIKRIRRDGIYA